jgi:uncharacterized protein
MSPPIQSIRYPPAVDPGAGRLAVESDYGEHVDQLVRQVLLTSPGERVNRPSFGCRLRDMVFGPGGDVTATLTQVAVFQGLNEWLGTIIDVDDVGVVAAGETLEVRVAYTVRALGERRYLNLEVNR